MITLVRLNFQVCVGVDPASERGFNWCCELGRAGPLAVPSLQVAPRPVTVAQLKRFVFEEQVGSCLGQSGAGVWLARRQQPCECWEAIPWRAGQARLACHSALPRCHARRSTLDTLSFSLPSSVGLPPA